MVTIQLEVVSEYQYLGILFNYNGSFKKAVAMRQEKALKAQFSLLVEARTLHLPADITKESKISLMTYKLT